MAFINGKPDPAAAAYAKADEKTYWAKQDQDMDMKKLLKNRILGDRMVLEHFQKRRPKLDITAMINRGADLEDAGRLPDACAMFEKALVLEPGLLELRMYIGQLTGKINQQQRSERAESRGESVAMETSPLMRIGGWMADPGVKRRHGPVMPVNPQILAQEQRAQAAERRRLEQEQSARDALKQKRELAVHAQQLGRDIYEAKVGRANAQLAEQRRLADNMLQVVEERKRQQQQVAREEEQQRMHREAAPNPLMGHAERAGMPFQDDRRQSPRMDQFSTPPRQRQQQPAQVWSPNSETPSSGYGGAGGYAPPAARQQDDPWGAPAPQQWASPPPPRPRSAAPHRQQITYVSDLPVHRPSGLTPPSPPPQQQQYQQQPYAYPQQQQQQRQSPPQYQAAAAPWQQPPDILRAQAGQQQAKPAATRALPGRGGPAAAAAAQRGGGRPVSAPMRRPGGAGDRPKTAAPAKARR